MMSMGRFAKLRGPAIGWPVVAPPPVTGDEPPTVAHPPKPAPPSVRHPGPAVAPAAPTRAPAASPSPTRAPAAASPNPTRAPAASPSPTRAPAAVSPNPTRPPAASPSPTREPGLAAVPAATAVPGPDGRPPTSFRDRARAHRRLRYLRQTRELAFRDLGGFVFDAHRFERPGTEIIAAKLKGLDAIDRELRALELALGARQELMLLREPGVTVCPRCGVIHDSGANFCPGCGTPAHGPDDGAGIAPHFLGRRPDAPPRRP